ncbi:MAG: sugar porter family MFS transporter, partial [Salinivirgaceae bacterium]|nr:sugar porter family MFS transporter [Salinivirgaceae bacterium]
TALGCMLATSVTELVIYRFLGGLGIGIASIISPMYLSEISPSKIRGRMVSLYQMAITIGILTIYLSNYYLLSVSQNSTVQFGNGMLAHIFKDEVWRSMFGVGIIPAAIFLGLLMLIPESPRWLAEKGYMDKARNIYGKIRTESEANSEMQEIKASVDLFRPGKSGSIFREFRKPLFIGIILAFLVQFSGITAVIYYGAKIFAMGNSGINQAFSGQLFIGIINVIFTLVAIFVIDKSGRRPLIIAGAILSLVCHAFIGFFFYMGYTQSVWLVVFILLYTATFAATYGPVFWTLISEIYPNKIRGKAMSIAAFANWVATALVAQMVPWMLENISPSGTFWLFGICSIPAIYIGIKVIPETKGKTLEELEHLWVQKK